MADGIPPSLSEKAYLRAARSVCHPVRITVCEGKFHQVKRMCLAVGRQVLALHRTDFGGVTLDTGLSPGAFRPLTADETQTLFEAAGASPDASS